VSTATFVDPLQRRAQPSLAPWIAMKNAPCMKRSKREHHPACNGGIGRQITQTDSHRLLDAVLEAAIEAAFIPA